MRGIRVRMQGMEVGMQGIKVGIWGIMVGMLGSGCECGESGCFFVRIFMFIASAKIPEREESISPSSFHGQLPDY